MQGTSVRSLVWEDATCHGATKPVSHKYWACALRAQEPQLLSAPAATTEAHVTGAHTAQEKPLQWEAHTQQRAAPHSPLEKACVQQHRPTTTKK